MKKQGGVFAGLNSRSALCGAFLLSALIACLNDLAACVAALTICLATLALSAPDFAVFRRRLLAANAFILFVWLVVPWTTPGEVCWRWEFITITWPGLRLCLLVTLKANAIFCVFMALVFPLSVGELGGALKKLGLPDKLVWILLLMGRNVDVLGEEWRTLTEAAKLRGFAPRANVRTYKTAGALLAVLLLRANDRAAKTREAMLLRAFSGKLPIVGQSFFSLNDLFFGLVMATVAALLLALETGVLDVRIPR